MRLFKTVTLVAAVAALALIGLWVLFPAFPRGIESLSKVEAPVERCAIRQSLRMAAIVLPTPDGGSVALDLPKAFPRVHPGDVTCATLGMEGNVYVRYRPYGMLDRLSLATWPGNWMTPRADGAAWTVTADNATPLRYVQHSVVAMWAGVVIFLIILALVVLSALATREAISDIEDDLAFQRVGPWKAYYLFRFRFWETVTALILHQRWKNRSDARLRQADRR